MVTINEVYRVKCVENEPDAFIISANVTAVIFGGTEEETFDCETCTRPGPKDGFNPAFQQWLADNPDFPRDPFTPPTTEEARANMRPLTARQLRLGLVDGGIMPSQVADTIAALPAGPDKEKAKIEWEYATSFNRTHPLLLTVGAAFGLTDTQIDAMWEAALIL